MTADLSHLHDDLIVAEMQRRLDRGTVGFHGLLSTDQANHRDNWLALMDTIHDARNRYPREFGPQLILDRARALQDLQGPQTRPYAVNTVFFGKETWEQDHAPRAIGEAA